VVEPEVLGQEHLVEVLVEDFGSQKVGSAFHHDPVALELGDIELRRKRGRALSRIPERCLGVALADLREFQLQ